MSQPRGSEVNVHFLGVVSPSSLLVRRLSLPIADRRRGLRQLAACNALLTRLGSSSFGIDLPVDCVADASYLPLCSDSVAASCLPRRDRVVRSGACRPPTRTSCTRSCRGCLSHPSRCALQCLRLHSNRERRRTNAGRESDDPGSRAC